MPGTPLRQKAEAAIDRLRQKGGVFVDAVRATRMPMALTDPNLPGNPIVFANEAFLKLSGYSMADVLGQQPHFMNGPDTDSKDAARFAEAIRADQDDIIETVQYRKNGTRFIATVLISAFKDTKGHTLNHFMSWLDVTRRVDAEDEIAELKVMEAALRESERRAELAREAAEMEARRAQTLLAELQHRVRNTLAIVRSIARRTADNSTSVEDMLGHFQGRLDAFARVQAALTRNPDALVDLRSLVEGELEAHGCDGEQIDIKGPQVLLASRTAEQLGLAIHELTTNAVKHGALAGNFGKLHVGWKKERLNGSENLLLSWIESGVQLDGNAPSREGFGMEMILRSLPYNIGGATSVDHTPTGLRFDLRMPLLD